MQIWHTSSIQRGDKTGSRYVYPTINLDSAVIPAGTQRGVYASQVKVAEVIYKGALYFGPRLVKDESNDVLEIYLLDFSGQLTDETIAFTLEKYVREVMDFPTLEGLRLQVAKDIEDVRKALNEK